MKPPKTKVLYSSTSTWLVSVGGGHPRRLTPERHDLHEQPTSFSPDGGTLALTRQAKGQLGSEVMLMDLAGGAQAAVAVKAEQAAISPDGSRIAYVRARASTDWLAGLSNLFPIGNSVMQMNADGSCPRRVLSRPGVAFYGAYWQPGPGREAGPISC